MPATTLSHFTFHPPPLSSSPKSVATCLVSLNSPCRNLSFHDSVPVLSRFSSCWRATTRKNWYWRRSEVVSKYYDRQELCHHDYSSRELSTKSITVLDNCCAPERSLAKYSSAEGIHENTDSQNSSTIVSSSFLKFMLLSGFFILQDSQQALAGSDVATGLQSVPPLGDLGDISTGFASAFLLIFFSELGDKTFFIAALLAARNSAATVFTGTFGALAAMTIISVVLGRTFHYVDEILPFRLGDSDLPVDDIAAVCLLVYFGVTTLVDASSSDGLKAEDEQKEAELAVSKFSGNGAGILAAASTVVSTFALVFVAEWGDKSFFSTIALAAAASPLGVIGGALAGHGVATLLAVLGGSLLGTFLSEKIIAYVGGVLFLVFAAVTLVEIVN
ncbi:GDT1-like protein 1, chloroplastic [Benincasa hispida]|uniref:GDT1-like protein 1, chloroplastic n=1 Tax=Benincasa hispida TaxID=102211 RepID=UPI001901C9CB|nr:GDT1-like protein 1, chloroplastic [Benincasa hispida]XP_038875220.1 GDT1-like protein 1, chloroplastic [Benincasa hispida]